MQPGVEAGEGNQWTLYAEAILLPFCLGIVGKSSAPNECSYLPMADIQIDLRNSRMTNLNKRPDAKYQEGVSEGSDADLDNSATGKRVVTGCSIECSVCFLLNEYPGGKMKVEQNAHTYSSSLDIKGCLKMKEVKHSVVKLRRNVWAISGTVTSGKLNLNLTRVEVSTSRYTTELYKFFL